MIQLRLEYQENPVADEVSAITAVVRPILKGLLYSLKKDVVEEAGGHENAKLVMLPRLYRPGDGDCGLCFEYAIHDALSRHDPEVEQRLLDAMGRCNARGSSSASILFGAEKTGSLRLIDTAKEILTDESRLLAGSRGNRQSCGDTSTLLQPPFEEKRRNTCFRGRSVASGRPISSSVSQIPTGGWQQA